MEVKVSLTIVEGEDVGKTFHLSKPRTVLGRSRGDIRFADPKVSGEHLCIHVAGKEVIAEDLASTNGSYLNDRRISEKEPLKNLDELTVGYTRCRISIVEDLEAFRRENQPTRDRQAAAAPPAKRKAKSAAAKAPQPAVEDGGDIDIGSMIDEELKRFSRWDIASGAGRESELQMPKVDLTLELIDGPEKGRLIRLTKGNSSIGRGKADVKINDGDISRTHANIECFSVSQIFVRDMASTNGTFVNNKRVSYARLTDGDLIQVGSTLMRFRVGQG